MDNLRSRVLNRMDLYTKINSPKYVITLARELRQNLTPSEKLLWNRIKNKQLDGYKFRCQHPVSRYILDFYCHKFLLGIEIDGDVHKTRKDYDAYRDTYIAGIGIKTIKFTNVEITRDTDNVLQIIRDHMIKE